METRVNGAQPSTYRIGPNDVAARSLPAVASQVAAGKQVLAGAIGRTIPATGHEAVFGNIIRFTSGDWLDREFLVTRVIDANSFEVSYYFPPGEEPAENDEFTVFRIITPTASSTGSSSTAIEFTLDGASQEVVEDTGDPLENRPLPTKLIDDEGTIDIRALLESIESELTALSAGQLLDTVDFFDTNLLDCSVSNIPKSSTDPLEVVAVLAADVQEIEIVEDIGENIGLYIGAAAAETIKSNLPLGGGRIKCYLPAGTRISLKAIEDTAISSGKMRMNFLG